MCEAPRTAIDDCCCFAKVPVEGREDLFDLNYECPMQATLCQFTVEDENDKTVVVEPSALTCALKALRDRTAGWLRWVDYHLFNESFPASLFVQDDGTVLVVMIEGSDAPPSKYLDIRRATLKPLAYFTGCLALTDDFERFECLMGFEASVVEVCIESFNEF